MFLTYLLCCLILKTDLNIYYRNICLLSVGLVETKIHSQWNLGVKTSHKSSGSHWLHRTCAEISLCLILFFPVFLLDP